MLPYFSHYEHRAIVKEMSLVLGIVWPGCTPRGWCGALQERISKFPCGAKLLGVRDSLHLPVFTRWGKWPYSVCNPSKHRLKENMEVREKLVFTWGILSPWVGMSFLVWIEFLGPGNVTAKERRNPGVSSSGFRVGPAEQWDPSQLIPWDCKIGQNDKCDGLLKQTGTWEVRLRGPTLF